MPCKATIRQVGDVTIVDISGRITLGDGSGVVRETAKDVLKGGQKSSVTRVEVNWVWVANKFPSVTFGGSGEPLQCTAFDEDSMSSPGCANATVNWSLLISRLLTELNDRNAWMGCDAVAWFAAPRRLVMRRVTFPEAGTVKLSPLNDTALGAASCASPAGVGPDPVSLSFRGV